MLTAVGNIYPCGHPGTAGCSAVGKEVKIYCIPDSAWGAGFLLIATLGAAGYGGGGTVLGGRQRGGPAALRSHPHHQRWVEVMALVHDGVSFSRARVQGRGSTRSPDTSRPSSERLLPAIADKDRGGNAGQSRRKEKKSKKSKHAASMEPQPNVNVSNGKAEPGEGAAAGSPPAAAVQGSAAGDGGRWVHVS